MAETPLQREFVKQVSACRDDLFAYALSLVFDPNEAAEILQQATAALWVRFRDYDSRRPFAPWARKFVFIEVLRFRDRRSRDAERVVPLSQAALDQLAAEFERHDEVLQAMRGALQECLEKLRPVDLELVQKRYWEGVNLRRLAQVEGLSESQLYSRLHRIRGLLMRCIERTLVRGTAS